MARGLTLEPNDKHRLGQALANPQYLERVACGKPAGSEYHRVACQGIAKVALGLYSKGNLLEVSELHRLALQYPEILFDTMCVHPGLLKCKPETAINMLYEVVLKLTDDERPGRFMACHDYRLKCVVDAMKSEPLQSFIKANNLEKLHDLVVAVCKIYSKTFKKCLSKK